jgi:hypothetical protein
LCGDGLLSRLSADRAADSAMAGNMHAVSDTACIECRVGRTDIGRYWFVESVLAPSTERDLCPAARPQGRKRCSRFGTGAAEGSALKHERMKRV